MEKRRVKLKKAILHTSDFTEETARAESENYTEKDIKVITAYMQAWDGIHVTVGEFMPGQFSVVGWPPEEDQKVKEAIWLMEQDAMFGNYQTKEEFELDWGEPCRDCEEWQQFEKDWISGDWEPFGSITFAPAMVEILADD